MPAGYLSTWLAILMLSMLGCTSTPTTGTGGSLDDTAITAKVIAAIFREPALKVSAINVETFNGAVQLNGAAMSPTDMSMAVRLARGVGGVTSVRNGMWLMTCSLGD